MNTQLLELGIAAESALWAENEGPMKEWQIRSRALEAYQLARRKLLTASS